ncbi:MAG: hypothetical protein JWM21_4170 [Acidobacteria bacterium]|nr:hypothetical protein [Acidobacteriota bacterium]
MLPSDLHPSDSEEILKALGQLVLEGGSCG